MRATSRRLNVFFSLSSLLMNIACSSPFYMYLSEWKLKGLISCSGCCKCALCCSAACHRFRSAPGCTINSCSVGMQINSSERPLNLISLLNLTTNLPYLFSEFRQIVLTVLWWNKGWGFNHMCTTWQPYSVRFQSEMNFIQAFVDNGCTSPLICFCFCQFADTQLAASKERHAFIAKIDNV